MSPRVRRLGLMVCACAAAAGIASEVTPPRPFVVVGRSMLPGLAEGDVVSAGGWLSRWHQPQRHERWLVQMPDGTPVVKRIAGLPGERLEIDAGDLVINGERLLPSPPLLGETASEVSGGTWTTHTRSGISWTKYQHLVEDTAALPGASKRFTPGPIFDSLPEDSDERRRLNRASSFGIAAVIEHHAPLGTADVLVRIGPQQAAVHLRNSGRFAIIAGRLASRFVVAAWPIDTTLPQAPPFPSSPLPWPAPDAWSLITEALSLTTNNETPPLAIGLSTHTDQSPSRLTLHTATIWRGAHLLPAPNGTSSWTIPEGHVFLLGDHPSASRDSRHFGPVAISNLLGPLIRQQRKEAQPSSMPE